MKIDAAFKIEKAVSGDETRSMLCNPYLDLTDKTKPVLVATDGWQMAVVPVTLDEGDTAGYVSLAAIKEARKKEHRFKDSIFVKDNETIDGITMPRPSVDTVGIFPNWHMVYDSAVKTAKGEISLGINPALLLDLAKALGDDSSVTLTIRPDKDGKVLTAIKVDTAKATGVIMPTPTVRS